MLKSYFMRMEQNSGGDPAGGGAGAGGAGAGGAGDPPAFALPDAYKDRPYLKDVKSHDDVYKMLDGAQSLLGKRPAGLAIPDEKASPDEWNKFHAQLGRPEKADAYEFDDTVLGEGNTRDAEIAGKVKGIMHEAGLSGKQAKAVQVGYDKLMNEIAGVRAAAAKGENDKFDAQVNTLFGTRKDEVLKTSREMIEKYGPKDPVMQEAIKKLGNNELIALSAVLDNINTQYLKEGKAPGGGGGGGGAGGETIASLEAKAYELMATPKYQNATNPEYDNTRSAVTEIWKKVEALKAAGGQA